MKKGSLPPRHWESAASRTIAVTLGTYAATSLVTMALSLLLIHLGVMRVEAVIVASLASFLIFTLIALAIFLTHSATQAWKRLFLISLPAILLLWLLR